MTEPYNPCPNGIHVCGVDDATNEFTTEANFPGRTHEDFLRVKALYDELYPGWKRVKFDVAADGGRKRTECLWISPNTIARGMPLFSTRHVESVPAPGTAAV